LAHNLDLVTLLHPDDAVGWKDNLCDRWIGQQLSEDQIASFKYYWDTTPYYKKPQWAKGLRWFLDGATPLTAYDDCSWDFGLFADGHLYRTVAPAHDDLAGLLHARLEAFEEMSKEKVDNP
jgi:hypothetical protein